MSDAVIREEFGHDDWLSAIAAKAKRSIDEVRLVLVKNGIRPKPSIAIPKRLLITALNFTGQKRGTAKSEQINFSRSFDAGFWAFVSERNLRGKTTLLQIIRWCLTGRRCVDPIMADWFDTIVLGFQFDGHAFEVKIDDAVAEKGTLLRYDGSEWKALHRFYSPAEFENVMSAFFMGELGFQEIVNHVALAGGIDQTHGWPWLSTAMIVEADPKATFGNVSIGAMPTRMMQMFMGIPWANTTNDILAAKARYRTESQRTEAFASQFRVQADVRITDLRAELDQREKELKALPVEGDLRASLKERNSAFAGAEERHRKALSALGEAEKDQSAATDAYNEARRQLRAFKDAKNAGFVFRELNPVCCPRCDGAFSEELEIHRSQAKRCFVCDAPESAGDDDEGEEARLAGC